MPTAQTEDMSSAAAVKLVFLSSSQTLTAGGCSAAVAVQSQDTYGNVANVTAATTITPTMTPGGGNTYYYNACTTAEIGRASCRNSRNSLYVKDSVAGRPTL